MPRKLALELLELDIKVLNDLKKKHVECNFILTTPGEFVRPKITWLWKFGDVSMCYFNCDFKVTYFYSGVVCADFSWFYIRVKN